MQMHNEWLTPKSVFSGITVWLYVERVHQYDLPTNNFANDGRDRDSSKLTQLVETFISTIPAAIAGIADSRSSAVCNTTANSSQLAELAKLQERTEIQ